MLVLIAFLMRTFVDLLDPVYTVYYSVLCRFIHIFWHQTEPTIVSECFLYVDIHSNDYELRKLLLRFRLFHLLISSGTALCSAVIFPKKKRVRGLGAKI